MISAAVPLSADAAIRQARSEEVVWVLDSWSKGWLAEFRVVPTHAKLVIETVAASGTVEVLTDCGEAMGWIAHRDGMVWWVYVRNGARRNGFGSKLIKCASPVRRVLTTTHAGRALLLATLGRIPPERPWSVLP